MNTTKTEIKTTADSKLYVAHWGLMNPDGNLQITEYLISNEALTYLDSLLDDTETNYTTEFLSKKLGYVQTRNTPCATLSLWQGIVYSDPIDIYCDLFLPSDREIHKKFDDETLNSRLKRHKFIEKYHKTPRITTLDAYKWVCGQTSDRQVYAGYNEEYGALKRKIHKYLESQGKNPSEYDDAYHGHEPWGHLPFNFLELDEEDTKMSKLMDIDFETFKLWWKVKTREIVPCMWKDHLS